MNVRPQEHTSGRRPKLWVLVATAAAVVPLTLTAQASADSVEWPEWFTGTSSLTGDSGVKQLNAAGDTPTTRYRLGSRILKYKMRGTDVRAMQAILRRRGYKKLVADGDFGRKTRYRVMLFQRRAGLTADGVVGPRTMAKLGIRYVRSGPSTPPAPISPGKYPLVGPNAANARYLKAFPVAGAHTYFNDFGAPRPQGSHQGNDIMAARGVPLRAVANGVIWKANRVESGLGGIYVWLEDANGTDYYYAHMNSIASTIKVGTRVTVGQVLGTVGNTGDARYGAPHLHFEIRPEGRGPINPYTDLLAVDPEPPGRN